MLECPRRRSVVETGDVLAVRLVQRYREPLSPDVAEIRDHIAYGWLVADHAQPTVVAAGTWIMAVDELLLGRKPG